MTNNTDLVRVHDALRVLATLLRTPEFMAQFDPEKFAGKLERIADALAQQPAAPSGDAVAWAAMSANGSRVVSISLERDEYVGHVVPLYTALQQPAAVGVTKRELFTIAAMHTLRAGDYAKWEHLAQDAVSLADATLAALAAQQQGGAA